MRNLIMLVAALSVGLGAGWYLAGGGDARHAADDADYAAGHRADDDDDAGGDDDDDDDVPVRQRLVAVGGEVRISLTAAEVELAGIRTQQPAASTAATKVPHAGRVLDTSPLLAGQAKQRTLSSQVAAQTAIIARLDARLAELGAGSGLGARRDIAALELERTRERARRDVLIAEREAGRVALKSAWGTTLVEQTTTGDGLAQALLDGAAFVIGFTLPPAAATPGPSLQVTHGERSLAGQNLGPSPSALPGLPGRGWLGVVRPASAGEGLAPGLPVTVWITAAHAIAGVLVPASAVVWDADGRWIFLMPAANEFVRHAVVDAIEQPGGLLVADLPADTPVVVNGAQTLQGERFRGGIPDEDED